VQGSLVFIIAKPWDHLWWLAHLIGAAGFTILSYGVVRAFHTTRAFSLVFSQEEVLKQLAAAKEHAEHLTTQLQEANATLEIQASTDPLTGLSNRRHFMELCNLEVARAQRSGGKITMLALDLDHFKQINDRYGHAMGDEVLKTFAERASSELRPTDRLARLGGEEFMVLLPDTAIPEALLIAERIRSKVEQIRVTTPAAIISFTVSIGLAEFPTHGERLEQVFIRADECLYRAKAQGRNQIAHPL
jgi:diguanylate cyclase (GGDEF)-like protein